MKHVIWLALLLSGCAWHVGTVPDPDFRYYEDGIPHEVNFTDVKSGKKVHMTYFDKCEAEDKELAIAESKELQGSLQQICEGGWNPGRQSAICRRLDEWGISYQKDWICWTIPHQRNIMVTVKGKTDRIVYLIGHSDKIDAAPWGTFLGQLTVGISDMLTSPLYLCDGAFDNGCGSAVLLQLAKYLHENEGKLEKTYRILWVGGEEVGLRGSKSHVAGLSWDEWDKIDYVLNLDGFGSDRRTYLIAGESLCDTIGEELHEIKKRTKQRAIRTTLPPGLASDHSSFEGTIFGANILYGVAFHAYGAIIPRREWFVLYKNYKPSFFLASGGNKIHGPTGILCNLVMLPFSQYHGAFDSASEVYPHEMWKAYHYAREWILVCDKVSVEEKYRSFDGKSEQERQRLRNERAKGLGPRSDAERNQRREDIAENPEKYEKLWGARITVTAPGK